MKADKHVTVEKTAKRYKLALLIFGAMSMIGIILAVIASNEESVGDENMLKMGWGVALLIAGIFGWLITKLLIWWNHG